ncbi:hypothetical protein BT93_K0950 [Corymbia citriodora subsp. variegata]|nr:hypothetical protein BT93_K0950 [Corymbia citriodora subsp. variegata]
MDNELLLPWQSLSSGVAVQPNDLNCASKQSPDCFFHPNWDNSSTDQGVHFESALSSMGSPPAAPSSYLSNESVLIRELIGKLGSIGNPGEVSPSPHSLALSGNATAAMPYIGGSNSTNTSCYSTPLNSPPKVNFTPVDHAVKERFSSVAEFTADPGFAERAARFSCFGSRSFNGRSSQFSMNNGDLPYKPNQLTESGKFQRVFSSPSLKALGSQAAATVHQNVNSRLSDRIELTNSNEESSVSEQIPGGENGLKASNEANSRKRKAAAKGKAKEPGPSTPVSDAMKVTESNDNLSPKRCKLNEGDGNGNDTAKGEDDAKGNSTKNDAKPPEPPKDYIHVRARRGQATDSHSLAERVRREKISERMKLLQDLVPGCNKVTGKALMLDEIINYVQSLQRQVEFLSMKLASVNTTLDFNADPPISKDMFQPNNSVSRPMFPLDSSATTFHGHHRPQNQPPPPPLQGHVSSVTVTQVDPLNLGPCNNVESHSPLNDLQYQNFCGDDLQSIVQMGFGQNSNQETAFQLQTFHG